MNGVLSRRTFVRSFATAGALAGTGLISSCREPGSEGGDGARASTAVTPTSLTQPLLRGWADDIVQVSESVEPQIVAYVSMALRQVFVDHDFRDRASWLFDAHISVSTWHWRIPLPGDRAGVPIPPGDEAREFEEFSMQEWDPEMPPAMDDIRVVRGRRVAKRIDFICVPLTGDLPAEGWYRGGPWDVFTSDVESDDTLREDFGIVGTGERFENRDCTGNGEAVQFVSWASR